MASTSPARIDDELYASAKLVGEVMSRSAAQQVNHWARIGREVEAAGTSTRAVAQVLAGRQSYDELSAEGQAVVRARWDERIAEEREGLALAAEFAATGQPYAELDDDGNVVVVEPMSEIPDVHRATEDAPRRENSTAAQAMSARLTAHSRRRDRPGFMYTSDGTPRPTTDEIFGRTVADDAELARFAILEAASSSPLTKREAQVLALTIDYGLSTAELSELLQISDRRVRALRRSAHQKLTQILGDSK